MLKRTLYGLFVAIAVSLIAIGCSDNNNQWRVEGQVSDGEGSTLLLEKERGGEWYIIDSLKLASNGNFEFVGERNVYPTIYRLRVGEEYVYFPVDSTETLNVQSTIKDFAKNGKISGSISADKIQKINDAIAKTVAQKGESETVTDETLKMQIVDILGNQWDGIAAYYVINKQVGGKKLYDMSRKNDMKVIRAVANMYQTTYPDDPRTKVLTDMVLKALRGDVEYYATEIPIIDVSLPDDTGEVKSLSKQLKDSKVLVLDFCDYSQDYYPAYNLMLGEVYNKYKDNGLTIYQVGFDADEFEWARTAKNLPWTTVYNSPDQGLTVLGNYNVTSLPTLFVFNSSGEKVERIQNPQELESAVKKML